MADTSVVSKFNNNKTSQQFLLPPCNWTVEKLYLILDDDFFLLYDKNQKTLLFLTYLKSAVDVVVGDGVVY